jgi:hypothetical protein
MSCDNKVYRNLTEGGGGIITEFVLLTLVAVYCGRYFGDTVPVTTAEVRLSSGLHMKET